MQKNQFSLFDSTSVIVKGVLLLTLSLCMMMSGAVSSVTAIIQFGKIPDEGKYGIIDTACKVIIPIQRKRRGA